MRHFYVHIPFCTQKCLYCKFALTPIFSSQQKALYLTFLIKEIRQFFQEHPDTGEKYTTLYFGGGTPSILSLQEIQEVLAQFPGKNKKANFGEFSFECNPEDISFMYIQGLGASGVNRISLGIQSLNPKTLQTIARAPVQTIYTALDILNAAAAYFPKNFSINIDIILGLPFVTYGETLQAIKKIHTHFPAITHTSVYMLEAGHYPKDWGCVSLSLEEVQQEFGEILKYFQEKGWNHYELSNWAKPGYTCVHNRAYWNHCLYKGFGMGAASLQKTSSEPSGCYIRSQHAPSFSGYYRGKEEKEYLSQQDVWIESLMFGLRTEGIPLTLLEQYAPIEKNILEKKLAFLYENKLITQQKAHIIPTKTGIFLIDSIISEILTALPNNS